MIETMAVNIKAKVGWEIADGQFLWEIEKKFDSEFDAQNWVNNLLKNGNYDSGQVQKIN